MSYHNLAQCVNELEKRGHLRRVDFPVDPYLEMGVIQRRALRAKAPALLFTRPRGTNFPMLANLFGTRERVNFIFRSTIHLAGQIFQLGAEPARLLKRPLNAMKLLGPIWSMRARVKAASPNKIPCLANKCGLQDLPRLVSWPEDGGPFITLPLVYTEDPVTSVPNLGMYRVQMAGNEYGPDEVGLHYQLHRGIGAHHARAMELNRPLPVHIYVGGPPALTLAAVMPMPEGISELMLAGMLSGSRLALASVQGLQLPCIADCDFLIAGKIMPETRPEGPFGDHLGYYSLKHDFPALKVENVFHRAGAIWPFTTVGRPPQEDTVFGDIIHELTAPLVKKVFPGVREVRAVDAAGVHPLLLAVGSERYVPYEASRRPRELLTLAMHLLGMSQTSLAKYLFICAGEDSPVPATSDVAAFLEHMLERTHFNEDLHFITGVPCDTLDYSGTALHEGSKLVWASSGAKCRSLARELSGNLDLPPGFYNPRMALPGVAVIGAPPHTLPINRSDETLEHQLAACLAKWEKRDNFPLVVICDDPVFTSQSLDNFLWVTFTRSDPARDIYGVDAEISCKRWLCRAPLIIDARLKAWYPRPLEEDAAVVARVENLASKNGPLAGLF